MLRHTNHFTFHCTTLLGTALLACSCALATQPDSPTAPTAVRALSQDANAISTMSTTDLRELVSKLSIERRDSSLTPEEKEALSTKFQLVLEELKKRGRKDAAAAPVPTGASAPLPPATPTPPEQLRAAWKRAMAITQELAFSAANAPKRSNLQQDLMRVQAEVRLDPASAQIVERVPVDPRLLATARATDVALFMAAQNRTPGGRIIDPLFDFTKRVQADLSAQGSEVEIGIDSPLAMIGLTGMRWQVEDAKIALKEALPAYLGRLQELAKADADARRDREREANEVFLSTTVNVTWQGGKLGDLIEKVRACVVCNVVLADPQVADITIPKLHVGGVLPEVFFKSLQYIPLEGGSSITVDVVAPPEATVESGKAPTAVLAQRSRPMIIIKTPKTSQHDPSVEQIFDLGHVGMHPSNGDTSVKDIKSLIEAIDFTVQADGCADEVKVRYHEPTKLLFVKGPRHAMALISEIVSIVKDR